MRLKKNKIKRTVSVLLLEDRENLGEVGDVVAVKPGYARNYLIPSGRATLPTADALQQVERAKVAAAEARKARQVALMDLAESLGAKSITLEERASEEGHLFGSVSATTIVEKLAADGVEITEKMVELAEPIKELGIFNVPIRVSPDHATEIRVWVVEPSEDS
ncbi:MAG: 50S ribosomal protein L9 [Planctomycetota bacterium]